MSNVLDRLKAVLADRYAVEREIGSGGMAVVYLAQDLRHERKVAIKVLRPELTSVVAAERFLREIKVTAGLTHPHILPLLDSGEADGLLYFVMPYVEGESLREKLNRENQLPVEGALRIAREVADALGYAHEQKLLHRDIKPENILLEAGHAVVADFGIARALSAAGGERLTETGISVGTVEYMSPEQATGEELDVQSDIYSLGCVLYEMLVGEPPYTGPTGMAVLAKRLSDPVPSARRLRGAIAVPVDAALLQALAKEPVDRFGSAREFVEALVAEAGADVEAVKSIAVLPFANMSPDPENEYFSDGVTEDIITHLCKFSGLKVISRTSVMRYKVADKNLREIGGELGVANILEGSVRRVGERVRITAQLVDAQTDEHLWAETYDRDLTDIFSIQSDVALQIADALKAELSSALVGRIKKLPTANLDAHNSYLLGRFHWNRRTKEGLRQAIEHFEQAIEEDSSYALAYSGLSDCYCLLPFYGGAPPRVTVPKAKEAAYKAVELDATLAEAHASLGLVLGWYEREWTACTVEFERALKLNPGYAAAHHWYGWYLALIGQLNEAIAKTELARDLDPFSLIINTDLGDLFYYAGRYQEAIEQQQSTLRMDPSFSTAHLNLGRAYLQVGMTEKAIKHLQEGYALSGNDPIGLGMLGYTYAMAGRRDDALRLVDKLIDQSEYSDVPSYLMAMIYTGLTAIDEAFEWLNKALDQQDSAWLLWYLKADPWADSLRSDPRFKGLTTRMAPPNSP